MFSEGFPYCLIVLLSYRLVFARIRTLTFDPKERRRVDTAMNRYILTEN